MRVRSVRHGLGALAIDEILMHAEFTDPDPEDDPAAGELADAEAAPVAGALASTSPKSTAADSGLQRRIEAVNYLMTGYADGIENPRVAPHPEYGPQNGKTLEERIALIAHDNGQAQRTVERWLRTAREYGTEGLIDKRKLSVRSHLQRCPIEIREAMGRVAEASPEESRITDKLILTRVKAMVRSQHGADYKFPSDSTLRRVWREYKEQHALHLSKKNQRGAATRPKHATEPLLVSRPFEVVELDSTPLDVLAVDERTGDTGRPWLSIAVDVYSRSIVGWRFTPSVRSAEKKIDASSLLYSILTPHTWEGTWGEHARWRYGVPERLVLPGTPVDRDNPIAGKPFGEPASVTIDNGAIYASKSFKSACARLGISMAYGRGGTPTDKPHVERTFRTIREGFVQHLPGYTGPSVADRGSAKMVEKRAVLTIGELEALFAQWVVTVYQNTPHKGLRTPALPAVTLTPNEKFDAGIAATGFVPVIADRNLTVSLLEPQARKVTTSGIQYAGLFYDSPDLDPYRNRKSPFNELAGRHPIRVDPRDLSVIYFWLGDSVDPTIGEWVAIPSRIRDHVGPFSDAHLAYVKTLIEDGDRRGNLERQGLILEEAMLEVFQRVNTFGAANKREKNVFTLGDHRTHDATATFPHTAEMAKKAIGYQPGEQSKLNESTEDEDWETVWDEDITPFPSAYDFSTDDNDEEDES